MPHCRLAEAFADNLEVCPRCDHHYKLSAEAWIDLLLDPGSFEEHDAGLEPTDPLGFVDSKTYSDRIVQSRKKSGVKDAFMSGSVELRK